MAMPLLTRLARSCDGAGRGDRVSCGRVPGRHGAAEADLHLSERGVCDAGTYVRASPAPGSFLLILFGRVHKLLFIGTGP
jgi:hypothetical protein